MSDFDHGAGYGSNIPGLTGGTQAVLEALSYDYLIRGGGESVYSLENQSGSTAPASQELTLAGFVAKRTEPINNITVCTSGTAAAATPTVCRFGVYRRETNGDLTLLAATANDTTLFAATNTLYTKALSTTFYKQLGVEYMIGLLIVSGVARPTFFAPATAWPAGWLAAGGQLLRPAHFAKVTAQADLGAIGSTIVNANVVATASSYHCVLTP